MERSDIPNESFKTQDNNRALWKGLIILGFMLLLLLPMAFIRSLIAERAGRQNEVITELSAKWAKPQTVSGPVLMIPYDEPFLQDGKQRYRKNVAYFLPDDLSINGDIVPQSRKRSLYEVSLMRSDMQLKGKFRSLDLAALGIRPEYMHWSEARFIVGLTDLKGLSKDVVLHWSGQKLQMASGLPANSVANSGLNAPVSVHESGGIDFDMYLSLKSSQHIYFKAWGNNTDIELSSRWTAPAFEGMPATTVSSTKGFKANWKLIQAARPYPQQWKNTDANVNAELVGVRFANANENYVMTERIAKYAVLFIGLTFAVFFLIEMLQKLQIHPLQYGLVGIALCVFYVLVLSISEYAGFTIAYAIASAAVISLLGVYVSAIFRRASISVAFIGGLTALYAYIYFLIQLEEMSLIFGSVALFLVVAAVMLSTRKVNWYALAAKENAR